MFASKDEKAKFRIGAIVKYDDYPAMKFKVSKREWDANGTLFYSVDAMPDRLVRHTGVRAKYLSK
jgi:hypothetical protein